MTTSPTTSFTFTSAKGGNGASTVAATFAVLTAQASARVLLVSEDGCAILGFSSHGWTNVTPNLTVTETFRAGAADFDVVVYDIPTSTTREVEGATNFLVVSNCYLALRKARTMTTEFDGAIVVLDESRALRGSDVAAALPCRVTAEILVDPAVGRAIDAGLLAARVPKSLSDLVRLSAVLA